MITKEALDIANALVSGVRKVLGLSESECHIVPRGLETCVGWSPLHDSDPAGKYLSVDMRDRRALGFVFEVFAQRALPVNVVMEHRSHGWLIDFRGPEKKIVRSMRDMPAVCESVAREIRDRRSGVV